MPTDPDHAPKSTPLVSEFATDPDMQEIIAMFVQEMPERVEQMERSWSQSQYELVKRMAHQLKGAGGGYGYPTLGQAAGELEASLNRLMASAPAPTGLDQIRAQLDSLIDLCNRVA